MRDRPYNEVMIERFRADPAYAATLLNSILEDGDDQGELKVLLPLMVTAFSDGTHESQTIHDVKQLVATFRAMGLRLSVAPVRPKPRRRTTKKTSTAPALP